MKDLIAGLEQRTFVRYALGVGIGLAVTILLFLLMEKLIESDRTPYSEPAKGELLSFVRLLEEPPPVTRESPKEPPEVEPPPVVDPPELAPRPICKKMECGVPVEPPPPDRPEVTRSGVATNGEFLPIMKVATKKYRSTDISGNYADMARAFGGYGERVTEPAQIVPAIRRGIEATESGTPALLEFITEQEISISSY